MAKSELWWASIGGNKCEPIRIMKDTENNLIEWYSIGCADPHPMTIKGIELIEQIEDNDIPLTSKEAKKKEREWKRDIANRQYGYRRFD